MHKLRCKNFVFPKYIYIHWPFCKSKCHYCDFIACPSHDNFMKPYHEALLNEIKSYVAISKVPKPDRKIETIFLGGGTPSMYPLDLLKNLFGVLQENFNLDFLKEVTIECNPQGVMQEHLKVWRKLGINRLSIGRFRPSCNHHIGIAGLDGPERVADGMRSGRACRGNTDARSLGTGIDLDLPGGHVGYQHGDKKGADLPGVI